MYSEELQAALDSYGESVNYRVNLSANPFEIIDTVLYTYMQMQKTCYKDAEYSRISERLDAKTEELSKMAHGLIQEMMEPGEGDTKGMWVRSSVIFSNALASYIGTVRPEIEMVEDGFRWLKEIALDKGAGYALKVAKAMDNLNISSREEQKEFFDEAMKNEDYVLQRAETNPYANPKNLGYSGKNNSVGLDFMTA